MKRQNILFLLCLAVFMLMAGTLVQAQSSEPVIRFINLLPDDEINVQFYLNEQGVIRGDQPYLLQSRAGTGYLSLESDTYNISVRLADTGEVLATQDAVTIADGAIYTAVVWQSINDTVPRILLIDETEAVSDLDISSGGFMTILSDTNVPLGLNYTLDGQSVDVATNGITIVPITVGEHSVAVSIAGNELNSYADAAYAIFPESEVDLAIAQFEELLDVEISEEIGEYNFQADVNMSANQSVFLVFQLGVNMTDVIDNISNSYFDNHVNFIYGLGVEAQGSVALEEEVVNTLASAGLRHSYEFTPSETRDYVISLDNASDTDEETAGTVLESILSTSYDPYLLLLEGDALLDFQDSIIGDDGRLIDTRAEMTISLTAGVTYTIQVASRADVSGGDYILVIR
ncbi:MAG: hypothetical protein Phog2KO_13430 [Phototrophicaceae bacterium]